MRKDNGYVQELGEWLTLRNYAEPTIKSYTSALRQFMKWRVRQNFGPQIKQEDARRYILHRYERGLSWQTINGDYTSLQRFFTHVLHQDWDVDHIPRPRKERPLPSVLSREEVERLINFGVNLKDQAFMSLLYGSGLRLSEALKLEITHVDGSRKQLRVVCGKGRKDRYVGIPETLLEVLRLYYRRYLPRTYLFNGRHNGRKWANRSAQYAITRAAKQAGIGREVSPHVLRHCYATHHLEGGTSLVYLKDQLGHKNLKTTARYIHLCTDRVHRVYHPIVDLSLTYRREDPV
ncbi:MAG: tyrosine-type recombinase/integrase [Bacteroidota bacterium]